MFDARKFLAARWRDRASARTDLSAILAATEPAALRTAACMPSVLDGVSSHDLRPATLSTGGGPPFLGEGHG